MGDQRPEQSIASARASVMIYDDLNKKWTASGSSTGISKVHIYHHFINNTFRVVGRKLQDHEVVINCAILKGLKYNQATATFHQWRDNKQVYGLNFSCTADAEIFAQAMLKALDILNTGGQLAMRAAPPAPASQQQQQQQQLPPQMQQNNNRQVQVQQQQIMSQQQQQQQQTYQQYPVYQAPHQHQSAPDVYEMYEEYNHSGGSSNHYGGSDGGYEIHQTQQQIQQEEMERRLSLQQQHQKQQQQQQINMIHTVSSSPNMSQPPTAINSPGSSQPSPGHHRTSSGPPPQGMQVAVIPGPPAPPPPPAAPPAPPAPPMSAPAPPPPPLPNNGFSGGAPPPPPPPLPNFGNSGPPEPISGLAAALQAAKLRKTSQRSAENSGGSTSSSGSSGYGTIGKGKEDRPALGGGVGMASMMDEMQKTLARRRAKVDKAEEEQTNETTEQRKGFEKSVSPGGKSSGGSESPKPGRRRFGSMADEIDVTRLNGMLDNAVSASNSSTTCSAADLESIKQEILREMKTEMNKMKQEIIEAIRCEMNRR